MRIRFAFPALAILGIAAAMVGCDDETTTTTAPQPAAYRVYDTTIHVAGQNNFRDIGGYVGAGGKRILFRRLFRSGALDKLNAADRDTIVALGIQQVIDLRTAGEIAAAGDSLPAGVTTFRHPLIADVAGSDSATNAFMGQVIAGKIDGKSYMLSLYDTIDSLKLANWKKIFAEIQTGKITLWHCTAGKDRAGMTGALVLASLGVDSATIVRDFLKSNTYMSAYIEGTVAGLNTKYGAGAGEHLRPVLGVDAAYIAAFFGAVNRQYGSMGKFLTAIEVDTLRMRSLYLEP